MCASMQWYFLSYRVSLSCQVYIENSGSTSGFQYPFGYLKASSNLTAVNLFIMPYNYPKIIPLIGKLVCVRVCVRVCVHAWVSVYGAVWVYHVSFHVTVLDELGQLPRDRMWPPSSWRAEFADYLTCLPCYYIQVSPSHHARNLIGQNLLQPLRNALRSVGAPPSLIPDGYDGQLSYTIQTYLRKLKKQVSIA